MWECTLESQHSEGLDRKMESLKPIWATKGALSKIKINEKRRGKRGEEWGKNRGRRSGEKGREQKGEEL